MDIIGLTSSLKEDEFGIFRNPAETTLSYPTDGNARCFQVEDRSIWFKHRNTCIVSMIRRFPPEGTILDVGGGNGYVTRRLLDDEMDAALLEPGPVGAYNAKVERKIPVVLCTTLENANFRPASINAIGCFDVIEHIRDDKAFIGQVKKALKTGGMFYATVPAHNWLWSGHDVRAGHYRRYAREDIRRLLNSDFELVFISHFFAPLLPPILIARRLPYLLGFSRHASPVSTHTEHGTEAGINAKILGFLLGREYKKISAGEKIRYGTSFLFAARKL